MYTMKSILLLCILSVARCHLIVQKEIDSNGNEILSAIGLNTSDEMNEYQKFKLENNQPVVSRIYTYYNEIWNKNGECYWPRTDTLDQTICRCAKEMRDLNKVYKGNTSKIVYHSFSQCSSTKNASIDTCDNWSINKCVRILCLNEKLGICEDKLGDLESLSNGQIFGLIDNKKACIGNGEGLYCVSPVYPRSPVARPKNLYYLGILFSKCISRHYYNDEELVILSIKGSVTCFTDNPNRLQFGGKRCDLVYPSLKYSCSNQSMQKLDDLVDCDTRDYIISCDDDDVSIANV